ncbi:MAG: M10 family metallopeptidase, partial [Hyphomonas sp.]
MRFDLNTMDHGGGLSAPLGRFSTFGPGSGNGLLTLDADMLAPLNSFEFATHTIGCCACGQIHTVETVAFKQAMVDAEGSFAPSAAVEGPIFAGDIPGGIGTDVVIYVGDTVVDTIEVSGDQDWFKIFLQAGTRYQITLTGTGDDPLDDPYLEIMNQMGGQITYNDDSNGTYNSSLFFVASTTGLYYINAHGWVDDQGDTSTGQYTLTVQESEITETYSFDQIADYLTSGYWSERSWGTTSLTYNVQGLTTEQAALAEAALALWASYTPLTFTEVTSGGQIVFTSDDPNDPDDPDAQDAHASNTVTSGGVITHSDVNISDNWFGGDTTLDSYTFQTYIHEIGHALGLGHAGPYNSSAVYGQDNIYFNDNWSYSVMSYFDQLEAGFGNYRFALGPQIADILAVQSLYGANPSGTHVGNTTYGFNSTESDINDWSQFVVVQTEGTYLRPPSYAIYDTGGIDTIDLSGFSNGQTLSLVPETFSSLGDRPVVDSPTYVNNVSIMRGTIIENAIGGSGDDTITGNSADNTITLGGGADTYVYLNGGGADTILDFSVANDSL